MSEQPVAILVHTRKIGGGERRSYAEVWEPELGPPFSKDDGFEILSTEPLYTHPAPADPAMAGEEWLKEAVWLASKYKETGGTGFVHSSQSWEKLLAHLRKRVQP